MDQQSKYRRQPMKDAAFAERKVEYKKKKNIVKKA